ncbi:MAG: T9SS type A sorting domain-containing protein [Bacteroidota bacterium]
MKTNYVLLLLFYSSFIYAQLPPSPCVPGEPICDQLTSTCFPLAYQLTDQIMASQPFPGCPNNTIDNPNWYAFEALSAGTYALYIDAYNCQGVGNGGAFGYQVALYDDCDFNTIPLDAVCNCIFGPSTLSANISVPGTYFLMIDGCAGDICEYNIDILAGDVGMPSNTPTFAPEIMVSDTNVCVGDFFNLSIDPIPNYAFSWDLPPGVFLNSDPSSCESSIWLVALDSGEYRIQANYLNTCNDSLNQQAEIIIEAFFGSSYSIADTICMGDQATFQGQVFEASIDTQFIIAPTGPDGCDTVVDYSLYVFGPMLDLQFELEQCSGNISDVVLSTPFQANTTYQWTTNTGSIIGPTDGTAIRVDQAATYYLTATAVSGTLTCTITDSINVSFSSFEVPVLDFVVTDVSCFGGANGDIDLTIASGPAPYTIIWNNGVFGQEDIFGLAANEYTVTVTAANGCSVVGSSTVQQPTPLAFGLIDNTASCTGDGTLSVFVEGGTQPYNYLWSNGQTGNSINNLEVGDYSVSVIDANTCAIDTVLRVSSFIGMSVSGTNAICDSTSGTATVTLSGTAMNVSLLWSNGGTGLVQTDLAPGGYSVTATDTQTGCRRHENVFIELDPTCTAIISGFVYNLPDSTLPCQAANADMGLGGILVELDNGEVTFTDNNGYYEFEVDPGSYEVQLGGFSPFEFQAVCVDPIAVNAPDFAGVYGQNNFFLNLLPSYDLAIKANKLNIRPGFEHRIYICVMNYGSETVDGLLTLEYDSLDQFISSLQTPSLVDTVNRVIQWEVEDVVPGPVQVISTVFYTSPDVPLGTTLNYTINIEPTQEDTDLSNNQIFCTETVVGSYDPNDKQVNPKGIGPEGLITKEDTMLSYLVRFQNTGTDTAFTVIIRDTLDSDLEVRNVLAGPASHDYELKVDQGHILEFQFDNILLPDSNVNEPASNGFVFFDVLISDLTIGTQVDNSAAIYFDFNAPVITNTVTNSIYRPAIETILEVSLCAGEAYEGIIYTEDATLLDTIPLSYSDSVIITNIDVWPQEEATQLMGLICDEEPFLYNGISYDQAGIYLDTLANQLGCDSLIELTITADETVYTDLEISLAPGELYDGQAYETDTLIELTYLAQSGCDSIVRVQIEVSTTAVFEPSQILQSANLYPNPTSGAMVLHCQVAQALEAQFQVYDITGQAHWSVPQRQNLTIGKQEIPFDLHHLPAGTYTLVIQTPNTRLIRKFVKLD